MIFCSSSECQTECSQWKQFSLNPSPDYMSTSVIYQRICNRSDSVSKTEYKTERNRNCSFVSCSTWTPLNTNTLNCVRNSSNPTTSAAGCTDLRQSTCHSSCGFDVIFCKSIGVACPCLDWQQTSVIATNSYSQLSVTYTRTCTTSAGGGEPKIEYKYTNASISCSEWRLKRDEDCILLTRMNDAKDVRKCTSLQIRECRAESRRVSFCEMKESPCPPSSGILCLFVY